MNVIKKGILFAAVLLLGTASAVFADRGGVGKKVKSKVKVNITMPATLRNSIGFNLRNGLVYKGSFTTNKNGMFNTSLATYQKGNTVYIIPYKHKIMVPEVRQGYTGVKIILKPRK